MFIMTVSEADQGQQRRQHKRRSGPLSFLTIKDFLSQQHKSRSHNNGRQNGPHKQFYR
jgi:hypothetical protein